MNSVARGVAIACLSAGVAGMMAGCGGNDAHSETAQSLPRNVILIISDGTDDQMITMARNYLVGAAGMLELDKLPMRGAAQVLTINEQDPSIVEYVADSSNGGTSLAAGAITSTGRIGTIPQGDADVQNILELAKAQGYRTGVVTTAKVTDATPAAFLAHVNSRMCDTAANMNANPMSFPANPGCLPDKKANGGKGSIVEQIADGNADVVLGGGKTVFGSTVEAGGMTALESAQANGFTYVSTEAELTAYAGGGKLLGLFANSDLPLRFTGPTPVLITDGPDGLPVLPEAVECAENPASANAPSLAVMTTKALALLSKGNDKGFVLMIENASSDKGSHGHNPCGSIGEMQQLDEAVAIARSFAKKNRETLLLVTSDHGGPVQIVPERSLIAMPGFYEPYSVGYVARLITKDEAVMRINYATNNSGFFEEHTGVNVPVYADSSNLVYTLKPYMKQTEVFTEMKKHLQL